MDLIDWSFWLFSGHRDPDCGDDGSDSDLFGDGSDADVWGD